MTTTDGALEGYVWIPVVAGFAMLYMAWGIGANDVANAFGTSFGARSLTHTQAVMLATVCEFLGAFALGSHVSKTVRKDIVSISLYEGDEGRLTLMVGMMCALFAASLWLHLASWLALPVSTTHSIIGSMMGVAVVTRGYASVNWDKVVQIVISWVASPGLAMAISATLWFIIKGLVFRHARVAQQVVWAHRVAPACVFLTVSVVTLFMIYKGAKGLDIDEMPLVRALRIGCLTGAVATALSYPAVRWWVRRVVATSPTPQDEATLELSGAELTAALEACESGGAAAEDTAAEAATDDVSTADATPVATTDAAPLATDAPTADADAPTTPPPHTATERIFIPLNILTAAFESLAHGANDVANAIGPFNGIVAAYRYPLSKKTDMPLWILAFGGAGIVVGLLTYGRRVMQRIGHHITCVTPSRAFCIELAATFTILLATNLELPVSTTHASVGAVIGVGLVDNYCAVQWYGVGQMVASWVLTIPFAGLVTSALYGLILPAVVVPGV
jgi:phosphate/sulfate permease